MELLPFLRENQWSLMVLVGTFGLWRWALAGWRHLAYGSAVHIFRLRNSAVSIGLFGTLVAAVLGMPAIGWLSPYSSALLCVLAMAAHAALDPSKPAVWHHARLRPIFTGGLLLIGYGLARYAPRAELIPALFAAVIFHRHQKGGVVVVAQCFKDLDALRTKVLTLEAARAARLLDLARDKDRKAG